QRDRQRARTPRRARQQRRHDRVEIAAVEELRQRVVHGLAGEARLQLLDFAHLARQLVVEALELAVERLALAALALGAIALGARVAQLVVELEEVVLDAGAIDEPLARDGEQALVVFVRVLEVAKQRRAL